MSLFKSGSKEIESDQGRSRPKWIPVEDLTQAEPKAAYAYWERKRADRAMPDPKDINPTEIPQLLPFLSIADVLEEEPRDYFYRIEGEAVKSAMGMRRMGHRLSEFKTKMGEVYPRAVERLEVACACRTPLAQTSVLTGLGRRYFTIEVVMLPLSADIGKVERILMCIGFLARPDN